MFFLWIVSVVMLRLGHIAYSNCFPVHALLIDGGAPPGIQLITDIPSRLNAELAAGTIDVAPCSSIEYARHPDRYRLIPDVVIGSRGAVQSIIFESNAPLEALAGGDVAVPTASATSVVLLRAILEQQVGVTPRYRWFDQASSDPFDSGADAALWIGDVALRRDVRATPLRYDLGAVWYEWTGLPFAFAVWQTSAGHEKDSELAALHSLLLESRRYFDENAPALADRHAARYALPATRLLDYWRSLEYSLDDDMKAGMAEFFRRAQLLGEGSAPFEPRWVVPPTR
jgi:chorismate dehydratase